MTDSSHQEMPEYTFLQPPLSYTITIGPVSIHQDGHITRLHSFTTNDQAALDFWDAVNKAWPQFIKLHGL